ncbi:peptidoglycan editing factor PgeF [Leeia sp.]|uniref:peptidoglycan editing factor PgeF n=1 Tax=Leeia sp. TaxID=2884678 RepID=UPI0035ADA46D
MLLTDSHLIRPDWAAPAHVRALVTTRQGGVSLPPFDSLNTATHVQDDPLRVAQNRQRLAALLPAEPVWLNQVHGTTVVNLDESLACEPDADAAVSRSPAAVCVVQTADCLPVLFTDRQGTVVAAAHAGWRGLCAGVLEHTLAAMRVPGQDVLAWLGPAIGPQAFEVGDEVREAFLQHNAAADLAFQPHGAGKWWCDLYALARQRLQAVGVADISGGGLCTWHDQARFFSFRRDRVTGRMASLIWLDHSA